MLSYLIAREVRESSLAQSYYEPVPVTYFLVNTRARGYQKGRFFFFNLNSRFQALKLLFLKIVHRKKLNGKWFEPRSISSSFCVIVRVRVALKRTVVGN